MNLYSGQQQSAVFIIRIKKQHQVKSRMQTTQSKEEIRVIISLTKSSTYGERIVVFFYCVSLNEELVVIPGQIYHPRSLVDYLKKLNLFLCELQYEQKLDGL